jgi:lipoprotein signal peptidase
VLPANEPSHKRSNLSKKNERILYGCVLFFACADILMKLFALQGNLPSVNTSFLTLAYFANPGIAFSIPLPQTLTLIITGGLIIAFIYSWITVKNQTLKIALTAAIVGAGSNFFDRLLTGYTTDYFILFSRSAINIADLLIITGIGYCAWYYQQADRQEEVSANQNT